MAQFTDEQIASAIEALNKRAERTASKAKGRELVRANRGVVLKALKEANVKADVITALGKMIGTPKV